MSELFDTIWGFIILHPILPIIYLIGPENIPENYLGTFIIITIGMIGFTLYGYICYSIHQFLPEKKTDSFFGKLYFIFRLYFLVCAFYILLGGLLGAAWVLLVVVYIFTMLF